MGSLFRLPPSLALRCAISRAAYNNNALYITREREGRTADDFSGDCKTRTRHDKKRKEKKKEETAEKRSRYHYAASRGRGSYISSPAYAAAIAHSKTHRLLQRTNESKTRHSKNMHVESSPEDCVVTHTASHYTCPSFVREYKLYNYYHSRPTKSIYCPSSVILLSVLLLLLLIHVCCCCFHSM